MMYVICMYIYTYMYVHIRSWSSNKYTPVMLYCICNFQRKHPETIEDYESRKKVQIPAIKKKKHDENERIANARCGQSTLTNIVFTKEVVKKQSRTTKLDQLVLNFIVKGMHPLSTIEQPAFQQLVKGKSTINYNLFFSDMVVYNYGAF